MSKCLDSEFVNEDAARIAENIPGSALRILDGENHASYVIRSDKLYGIMEPFLTAGYGEGLSQCNMK